MYNSPHRSRAIDQIVEGFSNEAVLRQVLSGKIDDRLNELSATLEKIKAHEHSIHSVEKADQLVAGAEAKERAANTVREEADRQITAAQGEAESIIAKARVDAKAIKDKEVDAKTAASEEAKRIVQEGQREANLIVLNARAEADSLSNQIHDKQAVLAGVESELKDAQAKLGAVRRALGDTDRITQI